MPKIRITKMPWRVLDVSWQEYKDLKAQGLFLSFEPEAEDETSVEKVTPTKKLAKASLAKKDEVK